MSTLIMKFGGSAVGTVAALTQALSITLHEYKHWDHILLVASALDGVTDMLLEAAHLAQASNQRGYRRIAATLRTRHLALIENLPLGAQERNALFADIDRLLFDMLDECQSVASTPSESLSAEVSDRIVGVGERLSARIISALLRQNNLRGVAIDGTDIIVTDNVHGNASPIVHLTRQRIENNLLPMLERQIIPVVSGFIGATVSGKPTTIGRGGSDFTASLLAICTDAEEVWIWSDVDGMMSTDPHEVSDSQVIEKMSYQEVAELAYFGARILHARMVEPLREHQITLRVKNVYKPQQQGTLITNHTSRKGAIKAVASIAGIGLTANRSGSLAEITRIVNETLFDSIGSQVDVMISSQSSSRTFICFIIPTNVGGIDTTANIHRSLTERLSHTHENVIWQVEPVVVVTAIGEQLDEMPGTAARVLQQIHDIQIIGLAQGPSQCSLSVILNPADAEEALRRIHQIILNTDSGSD